MSRKSRARKDSAAKHGVDGLLNSSSFDTLLPLLDAASVSPGASHRLPSLAVLFEAMVKRSHDGSRSADASDLEALVDGVRSVDPAISSVEDSVPLDLRLEVEVPWFGSLFAIAPGCLERPVAMVDFYRLIAELIDPVLAPRLGYGLRDVGEVVLRRIDAVVRAVRAVWQVDQLPNAGDPPRVSADEVAQVYAISKAAGLGDIAAACSNPERAQAAVEALCASTSSFAANFDVFSSPATFGAVLGVDRAGRRVPLPAGFLVEALSGIGAKLAAKALAAEPRLSNKFQVAAATRIGQRMRGAGTDVIGPLEVSKHRLVHSLILFDERRVVALDVATGLSQADLLSRMPPADDDPLDDIVPGATVYVGGKANGVPFTIPDDAVIARGRVFVAPDSIGWVGGGSAPLMTLADIEWIVHTAQKTPEDLWAFLLELNRPVDTQSFSWDMIDRWEVWRHQRAFHRSGLSPTFMMFAAHSASAEWEEAARSTPVERALHVLAMDEIRSWPIRDTEQPDTADLLNLSSDEVWTVLSKPLPVAIRRSDRSGRTPHSDTLWSLNNAIAWKIEHCEPAIGAAAEASGVTGLTVAFRRVAPAVEPTPNDDAANESAARKEATDDARVEDVLKPDETADASDGVASLVVEWDDRLPAVLYRDAAAGEARIGALLADKFAPECRDAITSAWQSAPPGIRMDGYSVRQRVTELPKPLAPSLYARSTVLREFAEHVAAAGVTPGMLHGSSARDFESKQVFPWLLARLHDRLADLDPDKLLAFGLGQLECAYHDRWMSDLRLSWMRGFPSARPEDITDERDQAITMTRTISLLAEESLASPPAGTARTEPLAWSEALAIAQLCVESCMRSDALHHRLDDAFIEITDSYEVNVAHSGKPTDVHISRYGRVRTSATLPAAAPIDTASVDTAPLDAESADGSTDANDVTAGTGDGSGVVEAASVVARLPKLADLDQSMKAQLGFGIDALTGVLNVGAQWADASPESATLSTSSAVVDECVELAVGATKAEYEAALQWVTLRGSDLATKAGQVIPHWEVERRVKRLSTSPFVETAEGLWVLPWTCEVALKVLAQYLHDGRLPRPNNSLPDPVVQALDDYRQVRNTQLERDAAAVLDERGFTVRSSVKKAKTFGMKSLSGEIDVLCVDPGRGRIWVIEAKDPYTPFSPPQIRRLIDDFHKPKKYIDKLLGKVQDVKDNAAAIATTLGVPDPGRTWEVVPLMVTRHVEAAAFAVDPKVAFCVIDNLVEAVDADTLPDIGWFQKDSEASS